MMTVIYYIHLNILQHILQCLLVLVGNTYLMCFVTGFNLWKGLMLVSAGVLYVHFLLKARRVQDRQHVEQAMSP